MASFDFFETHLSQKTVNKTNITELSPTLKLAGPFVFCFFWNCWGVCQGHARKLLESTSTYVCTVCSILNILVCF